MITMDVKNITWVGNMYQKFENMCLEAEDIMYEDTVKYIENQMQAVGESVKKLYSDVIGDLLPPLSCDLDEIEKGDSDLPIDQRTDATLDQKPLKIFKERLAKANSKQNEDSGINHNVDNDSTHVASHDRTFNTDASFKPFSRHSVKGFNSISRSKKYVGSMDIKSNLAVDENKVDRKMDAIKTFSEITSVETDTCRTSQCCEISNEDQNQNQNQNHGTGVSKPASSEVTRLTSEVDHCNEIENTSIEQIPDVLGQVRSAEEKQIDTNSSCGPFGEPVDFSMDRTIQSDDCSDSMVVVSHPEQSQEAMQLQQDHLKLEETCVMVTGDELQLIPKGGGAAGNVKTNKKSRRKGFSLSKKSARKQEYEELAVWHGNSEILKGNNLVEDEMKSLLPPPSSVAEAEWELL